MAIPGGLMLPAENQLPHRESFYQESLPNKASRAITGTLHLTHGLPSVLSLSPSGTLWLGDGRIGLFPRPICGIIRWSKLSRRTAMSRPGKKRECRHHSGAQLQELIPLALPVISVGGRMVLFWRD